MTPKSSARELAPRKGRVHGGTKRMRFFLGIYCLLAIMLRPGTALGQAPASLGSHFGAPPAIPREFRAAWVATVKNIDWPSRPGLTTQQQQTELLALLDTAQRLNLNSILFQVRPACDALYESPHEPWSEFLTGRQGQGPNPPWDPLEFATREAHARGLELHAWFNPFRARMQGKGPVARNHISQQSQHLVQPTGTDLWLDPGEPEAREHAIKVILDVVRRYDIDGVHLDDYFYPYPLAGLKLGFPDDRSWQRYQRTGGRLAREDWRRDNVNGFVRQLSDAVHQEKAHMRFGISPFGIWRPGNPPSIRGMDAYDVIYADSRKWLQEGWVDYLAPQLYWPTSPREQSFPVLLNWWHSQNTRNVPLWPGIATARIGQDRNAQEIATQLRTVRRQTNSSGMLFWNFSSLRSNQGGIANLLTNQFFTQPALVPALERRAVESPFAAELSFELDAKLTRLELKWEAPTNEPVRRYVLQTRYGANWRTEFLGPNQSQRLYRRTQSAGLPEEVILTPIGRGGIAGEPSKWNRVPEKTPAATPTKVSPKTIRPPASNPPRTNTSRPKPASTSPEQ